MTRPGVSAGSKSVGASVKCTAVVSCPSGAALASVEATSVRASTQTMRRRARRLIGIVSFLFLDAGADVVITYFPRAKLAGVMSPTQ